MSSSNTVAGPKVNSPLTPPAPVKSFCFDKNFVQVRMSSKNSCDTGLHDTGTLMIFS